MKESQHQQHKTRWLLNILMIILETIYSFILKHDRMVRLQSQRFVDQKVTIKFNSYIPFFDFYVQFTDKGILFDLEAPGHPVDLVINSTLYDLIRIFVMGNTRTIRRLRFEGDRVLKDAFQDLIVHLTIQKLLSDWKYWLTHPEDDQQSSASKKRIAPLLEKIDTQRSKINSLYLEVKRYKNRTRRLEQKQKRLTIMLWVISLLFMALIVYNMVQYWN